MADQGARLELAVLEQAAQWFALLRGGRVTDSERERWLDWLEQSAQHRLAWQRVERIGSRFRQLPAAPALQALQAPARGRRRTVQLLGIAGLASAFYWLGGGQWLRLQASDYHTGVGERRALTLADGSRLWLNSSTGLDVHYHETRRRLRLYAGEVLVAAAPGARPLQVVSPHGRIQAQAARFSLRCDGAATTLNVFEGEVALDCAGASLRLGAGELCRFDAAGARQRAPAEVRREAWTRGLLVADNLRLDAFIEELAQHHHAHFAVAPAAARLRLVGTYELDGLERTLATLQDTLPVVVRRPVPWWISVDLRA